MHGRRDIEELTGEKMGNLFPGERKGRRIYQKWIEAGFPIQSFETKETTAPQKSQYYDNTLIANVSKGRLLGFWWMKRDISEKKLIEAEMLKHQKLESVGILAGGIAHDFNNILTAIIASASLMQRGIESDSPLRRHLDRIFAATERATALTQSILAYSRRRPSTPAPIKLNIIVENLKNFSPDSSRKTLTLLFPCPTGNY